MNSRWPWLPVFWGAIAASISACAPSLNPDQQSVPRSVEIAASDIDPAVAHANLLAGENAYQSGFIGEGENRIHYVEAGKGPTVLFVHGFPSFWYVWRDQMEALRHCRRVIAIDAPGAGLSGKPLADEAYRVENLAGRLHALIGELSPDQKITLVGHDWGGALAWSYAQWDPSRLDRLAIFSAPSVNTLLDLLAKDPEQRAASSYMPTLLQIDRERASTNQLASSFYALAYERMVETGVLSAAEGKLFQEALARDGALYSGIQWYKANVPSFDRIEQTANYWPQQVTEKDIPIMLVRGSEDRTFVKRMAEVSRHNAPQLDVKVINDVGHWTPFQNPSVANKYLTDFMLGKGVACQ